MKALKTFRKVAALATGALMVGATVFGASAAGLQDYPGAFIKNPAQTKVVIGKNADATDIKGAVDVAAKLTEEAAQKAIAAGGSGGGSAVQVSGESFSLSTGADHIYLGQDIRQNVQELSEAELPTSLADTEYEDDSGNDFDLELSLTVGGSGLAAGFIEPPEDMDINGMSYDEEATYFALHTTGTADDADGNPFLTLKVTNGEGTTLDLVPDTDHVGQPLAQSGVLAGWEIIDATADKLTLGAPGVEVTLTEGESADLEIPDGMGGTQMITLTLLAVDTNDALFEVCTSACDSKEIGEDTAKTLLGTYRVRAKNVIEKDDEPDLASAVVNLDAGLSEIVLDASGGEWQDGDGETMDGTWSAVASGSWNDVDEITLAQSFADSDLNFLPPGARFHHDLANLDVLFAGVSNAPEFIMGSLELKAPAGGKTGSLTTDGDTGLKATWNHENEKHSETILGHKTGAAVLTLAGENDGTDKIHVVEGDALADEEYLILKSSTKTFFLQVKRIKVSATDGEVEFKDVLSGETHDKTGLTFNVVGQTTTITIGGQTFLVQLADNSSSPKIRVFRGSSTKQTVDGTWNSGANVRVFSPFLPFGVARDHMVFFAENASVAENLSNTSNLILTFPTGTVKLVGNGSNWYLDVDNDGTPDQVGLATGSAYAVKPSGSGIVYTIHLAAGDGAGTVDVWASVDTDQNSAVAQHEADPVIGLIMDEYNDLSDIQHGMIIRTKWDSTNSDAETDDVVSTANLANGASEVTDASFPDDDHAVTVDSWGLAVDEDNEDDDQEQARWAYGREQLAYHVSVAAAAATVAGGADAVSGKLVPVAIGATVFDSEVLSDYKNWNTVVVGGPCANSVAADLMGNPADCAAGFAPGKAVLRWYEHANGNVALLAAGYSGQDTVHATAGVLAHYRDHRANLQGNEAEVSGSTMNNLEVMAMA